MERLLAALACTTGFFEKIRGNRNPGVFSEVLLVAFKIKYCKAIYNITLVGCLVCPHKGPCFHHMWVYLVVTSVHRAP